MSGPIANRLHTPRAAALVAELTALLPADTALFIVAVGPRADGRREIVLGGDPDRFPERIAGAFVLHPSEHFATHIETLDSKAKLT